jgi:hypothetical protein
MQYTNKANLHPAHAGYLKSQHYWLKGDISATGLISSPRATQLIKRHEEEIVKDVSENYKSRAGTEYHRGLHVHILERQAAEDPEYIHLLSEHPVNTTIHGWVVTGTIDLVDPIRKQIRDLKNTSVWGYIFGAKHEYQAQLNVYLTLSAMDIDELFIEFGFTDWHKGDTYKKDYPQEPNAVLKIPVWKASKTWEYISKRVLLHQKAVDIPDDDLPTCTGDGTISNERWEKPAKFAVYKNGYTKTKRASKLENSLDEANAWVAKQKEPDKYKVYFRRGEQTKCKDWCDAAPFCNQWARLQADEMEEV